MAGRPEERISIRSSRNRTLLTLYLMRLWNNGRMDEPATSRAVEEISRFDEFLLGLGLRKLRLELVVLRDYRVVLLLRYTCR